MGFSSFLSSKSGKSIPAFPYAGKAADLSHVVLVLPNDKTVTGFYDGYGKIHPDDFEAYASAETSEKYHADQKKAVDIWKALKPFMTDPELDEWDQYCRLVKIVRVDEYAGEKWSELKPAPQCPWQGFFYDGEEKL